MANDLAAVSAQNVELAEKVEAIPVLQKKLQVIMGPLGAHWDILEG